MKTAQEIAAESYYDVVSEHRSPSWPSWEDADAATKKKFMTIATETLKGPDTMSQGTYNIFERWAKDKIQQEKDVEALAQVAYTAYCASCGNTSKLFTGDDLPAWADMDEDIKEHWRVAASATLSAAIGRVNAME